MARRKKTDAGDDGVIAKANPIVGRLVEDAELRATVRDAVQSAEHALGRLKAGKGGDGPGADKRLQAELHSAVKLLHRVSGALGDDVKVTKRKRGGGLGPVRKTLLLVTGTAAVVVSCPWMRGKVLDALFGAEEEFEYSPPPMPDVSAPITPSVPVAAPESTERSVPVAAPESAERSVPVEPEATEQSEPSSEGSGSSPQEA